MEACQLDLPYYDTQFYEAIKSIYDERGPVVASMTVREWYACLLAKRVTYDGAVLIPVRAERHRPDRDWPNIWLRARQRGLPADLSSFLFRLLHLMLPVQGEIAHPP